MAANNIDHASFAVKHSALDVHAAHPPMDHLSLRPSRNYFDFVNAIRRDWNANYTIQGPFDWLTVANSSLHREALPILGNPAKLKEFLNRRTRIVGLLPYHAYYTGAPLSQQQYKELMQKAMREIKQVDPEIWCLGSVENNIVAYDRSKLTRGSMLDDVCRGTGTYPLPLSEAQTRMLLSELPWKDSLVLNQQGRAMIEDCGPNEFVQPMVYSAGKLSHPLPDGAGEVPHRRGGSGRRVHGSFQHGLGYPAAL